MDWRPDYLQRTVQIKTKERSENECRSSGHHNMREISPAVEEKPVERCEVEVDRRTSSRVHVKTLKHVCVTESHPTSRIPIMLSTTCKQHSAVTVRTTKTSAGASPPEGDGRSSEPRPKLPSANSLGKLPVTAKIVPQNIHKAASASHIISVSPKTLEKTSSASPMSSQAPQSQIPRVPESSPRLKQSQFAPPQSDQAEQSGKPRPPSASKIEKEAQEAKELIGGDTEPRNVPDRGDPTRLHFEESKHSENKKLSSRFTNSSTVRQKEPEDLIDVTTQAGKVERPRLSDQKGRGEVRAEVKKEAVMDNKSKTPVVRKPKTPVRTKDAASQTLIKVVDVGIQVNEEASNEDTSLVHVPPLKADLVPICECDHLSESNSDSDWLPRFSGPRPYKSPSSQRPPQHVCQIEIQLCSTPPRALVSELDRPVSPRELEKSLMESLEGEAEGVAPQDVVWDEQGMTWQVYGASLDMESLGFAIQSHLQSKIRQQERRIGSLRESVCLSEGSVTKGIVGKKRKRSLFRSVFGGSPCCSRTPS